MNKNIECNPIQNELVLYILKKYFNPFKSEGKEISRNEYSKLSGVHTAILTKIVQLKSYDIPISTISKICIHEKISLTEFFKMFEAYLQEKEAEVEEKK